MAKKLPTWGLPALPVSGRILSRIILGVVLIGVLLGYQPTLGFPPIKHVQVLAQAEQSQTISAASLPFTFGLPHPGYLSTPFSKWHPGVDIATGLGMPINPIAPGTVTEQGYNFWGLGLMVEVDHGYGYKSLYAHMGKIYVKKGQEVKQTDSLGTVGLTGNTSGPHTHMEVKKDNNVIDPLTILPGVRQMPIADDFKAVKAPTGGRL